MEDSNKEQVLAMVERMGVQAEKDGFSPAAARIFSLLLIAEPPHLTFEQLQQTLLLSKSSVSNALVHLQTRSLIDYFTLSGDRKRYFRIHKTAWYEFMKSIIRTQKPFLVQVINEALAFRATQSIEATDVLYEAKDFTDYMFGEMDAALSRWEEKQKH